MAIRFEEKGKEAAEPSRKEPAKASTVPDAAAEPSAGAEDVALPFAKPVKPEKKRQRPKR